ncbi:MAG: hypothetical protein O4805_17930 [Trichodesmium sp. St16_bin2-tuft]|nr:hypothetical protein [Trichodesmium sp. St16_bin2-tuft]
MEKSTGGVKQSNRGAPHGGMQATRDNNRVIMFNQTISSPEEQLSHQDILELLGELEQKISESDIPADVKDKTIKFLNSAKASIDEKEPDKEGAKVDLGRLVKKLQDASKVVGSSMTLFTKVKPIITQIGNWLGADLFR